MSSFPGDIVIFSIFLWFSLIFCVLFPHEKQKHDAYPCLQLTLIFFLIRYINVLNIFFQNMFLAL